MNLTKPPAVTWQAGRQATKGMYTAHRGTQQALNFSRAVHSRACHLHLHMLSA